MEANFKGKGAIRLEDDEEGPSMSQRSQVANISCAKEICVEAGGIPTDMPWIGRASNSGVPIEATELCKTPFIHSLPILQRVSLGGGEQFQCHDYSR